MYSIRALYASGRGFFCTVTLSRGGVGAGGGERREINESEVVTERELERLLSSFLKCNLIYMQMNVGCSTTRGSSTAATSYAAVTRTYRKTLSIRRVL